VRLIDPTTKGMIWSALSVFVISYVASLFLNDLSPSNELLRTMAGIGGGFFLAYVIEATWLAERFSNSPRNENLLGVMIGLAVSGLLGVIFALVLSETASGVSLTRSQDFYFWWSVVSLGFLGLLVALQPALIHFWVHESGSD
jgi:MFS family permease